MIRLRHNLRHKYSAIPTEVDGIKFSSKKEAAYYCQLKALKTNGAVLFFLRQVPFHLPGGVRFVIDFIEFWSNGDIKFVDVKGFDTPVGKLKRRMVEAEYPITIEVVK